MARPWMRGIQGTPQAWQTGSGESDGSAATQIYANPRNLRQRAFSSKSVEAPASAYGSVGTVGRLPLRWPVRGSRVVRGCRAMRSWPWEATQG